MARLIRFPKRTHSRIYFAWWLKPALFLAKRALPALVRHGLRRDHALDLIVALGNAAVRVDPPGSTAVEIQRGPA